MNNITLTDVDINILVDKLEKTGFSIKEWTSLSNMARDLIKDEVKKRNDAKPYIIRPEVFSTEIPGFKYNADTQSFMDDKALASWEREESEVKDANREISGEQDDRKPYSE